MGRFVHILQGKEDIEKQKVENSSLKTPEKEAKKVRWKEKLPAPEENSAWNKLLKAANALYKGQNAAAALHSVCRLGAECVVQPDGSYRLLPGPIGPRDWEQVKKELLVPYVPQLKQVYHFAQHGWVYLKSSVLDEILVIAKDKAAPGLPGGYEIYSLEDMKVLEKATPEEIRQVHKMRIS